MQETDYSKALTSLLCIVADVGTVAADNFRRRTVEYVHPNLLFGNRLSYALEVADLIGSVDFAYFFGSRSDGLSFRRAPWRMCSTSTCFCFSRTR